MNDLGLRYDTPDLRDAMLQTYEQYVAYCDSDLCCGFKPTRAMKLKDVKKTETYCPDCHYALIWRAKSDGRRDRI